jgi:hypothetical protein
MLMKDVLIEELLGMTCLWFLRDLLSLEAIDSYRLMNRMGDPQAGFVVKTLFSTSALEVK